MVYNFCFCTRRKGKTRRKNNTNGIYEMVVLFDISTHDWKDARMNKSHKNGPKQHRTNTYWSRSLCALCLFLTIFFFLSHNPIFCCCLWNFFFLRSCIEETKNKTYIRTIQRNGPIFRFYFHSISKYFHSNESNDGLYFYCYLLDINFDQVIVAFPIRWKFTYFSSG